MPKPSQRTRSKKKVVARLPGGEHRTQYTGKKHKFARCSICGVKLSGVPTQMHGKYSKTQRRPNRPYGGAICHSCLRNKIKSEVRTAA